MSEPSASSTSRLVDRYVDLSARRPGLVLAVLMTITVLLSLSIPRLSLHTQIEALLPADTASQRSNDESTRRYAGSSPYFLAVQSSDPDMNRRVTEEVLAEVKKWPETIWAIRARDPSFFLDRRLLFIDEAPLGEFADDVDNYVAFRKCEKMPGCIQLDDEPEQPSFKALEKHLKSQPEVRSLAALFGANALDQAIDGPDDKKKGGDQKSAPTGELCSPDGKVCVVQVTLNREPTDLEFAREMVGRGEDLLKRLTPKDAPKDTRTAVTGVYRNLPLARASMMEDLTRTFGLGILLMVGVVMLQFRRIRSIVLLFVPLIFGSVWALGIFAWISPQLNLISAAGFIILAGLGIDFSLHLLTHYGHEREAGHPPEEAVRLTMNELITSLTVAAITTACGFSALIVASFRGFAQLGQFATVGIVCTLCAALVTFPPLVLGLQKLIPREGTFARTWKLPAFLSQGFARTPAVLITTAGLFLFAGSLVLLPRLSLRYDLEPLIEKAADTGTNYRDALRGTSRGAVLLLADSPEELEKAASDLRERYPRGLSGKTEAQKTPGKDGDVEGAPVITPGTFLPKDQEKKLEHIALLNDAARDAMKYGDKDWKDKLRPWLPMLKVDEPLTKEELPEWVHNSLKERDGTFGTVGLTYQDYSGSHAGEMLELSGKLDVLRKENPHVRFASSNAVLGEVMPLLREDGWKVTGLALLGVFVSTLLIGRSRRRTMLILGTIFLAVGATGGLMVLLDWRVDFYNMLVFPVAFGIGVDGAIYVVWSVLVRGGKFEWSTLPVSARAVIGSTLTTLVVFASLATSENGGLSSLGTVATSSLAISLVANLIWLPAALSWMSHIADRKNAKIETTDEGQAGEPASS